MSKVKVEDIEFSGGYNLLMLKAEEGNLEEVQRILTDLKHFDINANNKKGYTALALAVKSGQIDVVKLFITSGSDVNTKNNSGQSPLFLACWNNFEQIARLLLDSGAEINTVDHRGWTPLMIAAYHGHRLMVRELLSRKADSSIQDLFGKKAIDRTKDPAVAKMLSNAEMGKSGMFSPSNKQDKSINQYSPIMPSDIKGQKNQPVSILKKSGSKQSLGQSRAENDRNQSLLSPQSTGSSIQKSMASTQPRRTTEPRRTTSQQKSQQNSQPRKDLSTSEKKSLPNLKTSSLNEAISPIKPNTSVKSTSSPTSAAFERQMFKDDLQQALGDQMNYMCQKIQKIVEQKVALEIPMQMQDFEKDFKRQVESLLRFKAVDIFKNLQAVFNLRLKFCLTRLGYDTASLDIVPFLETEAMYEPESITFAKEPLKLYNEKEYKAIQNDVDRLEKSILSQKSLNTVRSHRADSPGGHQCDHTSGVYRYEIKNELLDYLGQEVRSTTEYLLDHSNKKVSELTREESSVLYKKILAEVADNMEALEDELKHKFEDIINHKMNKVVEVLGNTSQYEMSSIDRVRSADKQHGPSHSQKSSHVGRLPTSESRILKQEYEGGSAGFDTRDDKYMNDFNKSLLRESLYSEKRSSEPRGVNTKAQDASVTKEKIQRIKNSLNFMDNEEVDVRPDNFVQDVMINRHERHDNNEGNYEERNQEEGEEEEDEEYEEPEQQPQPEHTGDDQEEEMERVYNPTYRSSLKADNYSQRSSGDYWNQGSQRNFGSTNKSTKNTPAQPLQGKGPTNSKIKSKTNQIPGHRFTPGGDRPEQEALQQYNFSNE